MFVYSLVTSIFIYLSLESGCIMKFDNIDVFMYTERNGTKFHYICVQFFSKVFNIMFNRKYMQ